jgi:hypothetical protein
LPRPEKSMSFLRGTTSITPILAHACGRSRALGGAREGPAEGANDHH